MMGLSEGVKFYTRASPITGGQQRLNVCTQLLLQPNMLIGGRNSISTRYMSIGLLVDAATVLTGGALTGEASPCLVGSVTVSISWQALLWIIAGLEIRTKYQVVRRTYWS